MPRSLEILGLAAGGMISASYGARLVHLLSTRRLMQLIACLLAGRGGLLLLEAAFPFQHSELMSPSPVFVWSPVSSPGPGSAS